MAGITQTYWRRIVASSAVYAAAGWAIVEAVTTVIERFGLPVAIEPLIVALYVAGLPVTVYLVWRTAGVDRRLTWPSFAGAMGFLVLATTAIAWLTRPAPQAEPITVAVLPCSIEDAGNANRAEGFAEDVHARLSRVDSLKVISWNSSLFVRERGFDMPQIAQVLHADRLVQCKMAEGTQRLAVFTELIDPAAKRVLWTHDYDFVATDIGTVVTEVVRTLLDVLASPVQADEMARIDDIGTFSPEAYDLYLQARGSDDPDEVDRLLAAALDIDPNYANALLLRADQAASRLIRKNEDYLDNLQEALDILRREVEKVLSIDPDLPDAKGILANICGFGRTYLGEDCSFGEERRLEWEACELRGNTAEGWACRHWLQSADGEDNTEALMRWLELEPTSLMANTQYMAGLFMENRADEMVAVMDTMRVLHPDEKVPFGLLSNLLRGKGRLDEVLAWRFATFDDRDPDGFHGRPRLTTDYMNLGLYGLAEEHAMVVHEWRRIFMPRWVALLWRLRGDVEAATGLMDWAVDEARRPEATPMQLTVAARYYEVTGDADKVGELYDEVLAKADLETLCSGDDLCVFEHAINLHHIASGNGENAEAGRRLRQAEAAFDRMRPFRYGESSMLRTKATEGLLRIEEGRYDEAIQVLRDAVFSFETPSSNDEDLALPLYVLQTSPLFDPVRDRPDFRQLLADYDAFLAPMRERARQATETGDWESLRQNTLRWLREQGE